MKLLPSPSISSSSTTSFDTNMCTPSKSATAGCLSAILRRFLCSRSLPTHPSDHITDTSSLSCHTAHQECIKSQEKDNAAATGAPGIVARLMGLDYLPLTSSADSPNSTISRTGSLNSAEFTQDDQMQRQSTIMSFLENEKFFVLSFEESGGGKSRRIGSKERKCQVGHGQSKRKRRENCRQRRERMEEEMTNKMVLRVLNEAELCNRISEDSNNAQVKKFTRNGARLRRKNRKKDDLAYQNDETESSSSSSQDASPVSVLDFGQFIIDPEVPISEEDSTKSGDSNSRRGLSAELDNHSHIFQRIDDSSVADDLNSNKKGETCRGESRRKANHPENYSNSWSRICRLAKAEVAETSWICENNCKFDELQEISKDFGLQILDELLKELVEAQHLS